MFTAENDHDQADLGRGARSPQGQGNSTAQAATKIFSRKTQIKKFVLSLNDHNKTFEGVLNLDQSVSKVVGLSLISNNEQSLFQTTLRLEYGGIEVLEEGTPAQLLYSYPSVPMNERWFVIDRDRGNGILKLKAITQDTNVTSSDTLVITLMVLVEQA